MPDAPHDSPTAAPRIGDKPIAPTAARPGGSTSVRVGLGWDRHRLEPLAPLGAGRPLVLGGVAFEHDRGPVSHSDGDALLHAITDAILGAIALPDIGQLFPNDDPRLRGADSSIFLLEAYQQACELGWRIVNLDAVLILERPKLGPRKEAIRTHISTLLELPRTAVNIKGKTGEGVDATGEERAVEAQAVVMLSARTDRLESGETDGAEMRGAIIGSDPASKENE